MIAFVRGDVVTCSAGDTVVVDIGALGVTIHCTRRARDGLRPGDHVMLPTSMVIREESWTVYGFVDEDERDAFEIVQTVSGVGPRIALGLLGALSPEELRRAVHEEDLDALMGVPGIGRKGAARIALELKDRLGPPTTGGREVGSAATDAWSAAVLSGLMSLGWSGREAALAVEAVTPLAAQQESPDVAELLRAALVSLDRR